MKCSHPSRNNGEAMTDAERTVAFRVIYACLAVLLASLSLAFTPIRPLAQLKEQDPAKIIAAAPEHAEITLPARYWRKQDAEVRSLTSLTNALTNGQLLLQARLAEAQNRQAALRERLVEARDAAALPTTKALYQAIIDWLDQLMQGD